MKNKKTFIVLAVLIAVLMLGIGYANITEIPLSISGSASASGDQKNFIVEFTEAAPYQNNAFVDVDATKVNPDATTATMTVTGLTAKGDKAVATFTVKNKSADLSAELGAVTATLKEGEADAAAQTANFKITTDYTEEVLAKDGEATFTVTVELLSTPIDTTPTATINVGFEATPVQP